MTNKKAAAKKDTATEALKEILAAKVGGAAADWKRLSKKRVYGGDTGREFANKATGEKIMTYERPDGLLCAEKADGALITARLPLSGTFNAAAEPSIADKILNMVLEDKIEDITHDQVYEAKQAGIARNFSFVVQCYDADIAEGYEAMYTTIYPTSRDSTFKCPEFIRALIPQANSTDECMETEYRFDSPIDTPAQIVKFLQGQGLVWDTEWQKRDKALYKEIKDELGIAAPKAKSPKH